MNYIRATVVAATVSLVFLASPMTYAQGAANEPLATGLISTGNAMAEVSGVIRDGDKLTIKVRFKPTQEGKSVSQVLYTGITDQTYENSFYLLSGDKKYLLLKDSKGVPLAPNAVSLRGSGPLLATWSGVFPAPPAGQKVTLYLSGVEPLGPFAVPAE
ncbi:DUF4352 domain-containing protein [Bordetella tumbae]|uniref:hypothetical protein n=1 Tax=Bordetella tumbae TaxID=1649139 RepID=UPI0039EEE030